MFQHDLKSLNGQQLPKKNLFKFHFKNQGGFLKWVGLLSSIREF